MDLSERGDGTKGREILRVVGLEDGDCTGARVAGSNQEWAESQRRLSWNSTNWQTRSIYKIEAIEALEMGEGTKRREIIPVVAAEEVLMEQF